MTLVGSPARVLAVIFGLLVGSFLNVVIARVPEGQSIIKPRSRCPGCGKAIAAYDNVPVLGWLWLRGRCRNCKMSISLRYPVVELLTALLFLAVVNRFGLSWLTIVRDWPFVALLVAITFIDIDHRLILDKMSLPGLVLGLATSFFVPSLGWMNGFLGAALGFGVFYFLALGYRAATGKSGLGGGDVKLLAMIGSFVGPMGVFVTIFVSSILGSVIGIAWALATQKKSESGSVLKAAIPYGPFLVLGALVYFLMGDLIDVPHP